MSRRDQGERPSTAERVLIALILGVLGFVTGIIAVYVFSDLPGVPIPQGTYLGVGILCGAACLVAGYLFSEKTTDVLGGAWDILWKLSVGILSIVRSLLR